MTIYCGDAVKWAREYAGPLHHALLCDCPYHLSSIVKRFGGKDAAPAQHGTDGAFQRMSKGFMGADWDGVDQNGDGVAMKPETWAAFAEVLYPGAFLLVFAGCLNDDAISMAMREAGLIKHHSLHWAFGSGFPKATRVKAGAYEEGATVKGRNSPGVVDDAGGRSGIYQPEYSESVPADDVARMWDGHRYGRQSLKPAVETILLFQVPYTGRPLDCIAQTGAGALNIAGGRVGTSTHAPQTQGTYRGSPVACVPERAGGKEYTEGRWPANLILGDSEAREMIDRQSGQTASSDRLRNNQVPTGANGIYGHFEATPTCGHDDSGGASRFFFRVQTAIEEADPVLYRAKSGRVERDAGLDGFDKQADAHNLGSNACSRCGLRVKHNGSGKGCECGDLRETVNLETTSRNPHPTVKPLSLTRYLASLLLPPPEYGPRRLFVPFAGVASEMCGADLAGWEEVNGVEQSADYARIGEARRRFWSCNVGLFDSLCEQPEADAEPDIGNLFTP